MKLHISDTFTKELPADTDLSNIRRQVQEACFSFVNPVKTAKPELIHASKEVADQIGLNKEDLKEGAFLNVFSGNEVLGNTRPYAMCYGGHQFGNWAGQLGDGRAINLTEVLHEGNSSMLQLKGAGPTPYSRTADGLAVLRSSIREYLCSEAMYYLGVPTTRALSVALTGDEVMRDMLYDGHPEYEKGAVVCRVAPTFLRFGSYEIFASRGDKKNLKRLVDYTLKYFYPHIEPSIEGYARFFKEVVQSTLEMIIDWQRVGFVHGVMNTDNMSILGLTIDYGPYGWLEGYDHGWTPNTTDAQGKRYRYGNQINVGLWNLLKLANALYVLTEDASPLEKVLEEYGQEATAKYLSMMKKKLGLFEKDEEDQQLVEQLEKVLHLTEIDTTIFFRKLSEIQKTDDCWKAMDCIKGAFYQLEELKGEVLDSWNVWLTNYINRLNKEQGEGNVRLNKMNLVNPKYVLRNYMAQLAIDDANKGDFKLVDELFQLLKNPYDEQPEQEKWFVKRPEWARNKVGCSMLSCSS